LSEPKLWNMIFFEASTQSSSTQINTSTQCHQHIDTSTHQHNHQLVNVNTSHTNTSTTSRKQQYRHMYTTCDHEELEQSIGSTLRKYKELLHFQRKQTDHRIYPIESRQCQFGENAPDWLRLRKIKRDPQHPTDRVTVRDDWTKRCQIKHWKATVNDNSEDYSGSEQWREPSRKTNAANEETIILMNRLGIGTR
jgi:hypothetical protein